MSNAKKITNSATVIVQILGWLYSIYASKLKLSLLVMGWGVVVYYGLTRIITT